MRLRHTLWVPVVLASAQFASALELTGRYGYAGEWLVSARLAEVGSPSLSRGFEGPLHLKHLAMCGPGEVSEKSGTLAVRRAGRRYSATFSIGGESCSVAGLLAEGSVAFADCGKTGQIPLRLWLK